MRIDKQSNVRNTQNQAKFCLSTSPRALAIHLIRPHGALNDLETSYTVYICTDTTFCLAPEVRGYSDYWRPNYASLSHDLQRHYPEIMWAEQIEPLQFRVDPRLAEIAQHLRERFQQTQTDGNGQGRS
jgi:hypothetical protein